MAGNGCTNSSSSDRADEGAKSSGGAPAKKTVPTSRRSDSSAHTGGGFARDSQHSTGVSAGLFTRNQEAFNILTQIVGIVVAKKVFPHGPCQVRKLGESFSRLVKPRFQGAEQFLNAFPFR